MTNTDSSQFARIPPILAAPVLRYQTPTDYAIPEGWQDVEVFTLDPHRKQEFLLLTMLLNGAIFLVSFLVLAAFGWYVLRDQPPWIRNRILGTEITFFGALILLSLLRIGFRAHRSWQVFRLVMAREGFVLRSYRSPEVTATVADIQKITETWDAFRVTLKNRKFVLLAKRVQGVERLQQRLAAFCNIDRGWGGVGFAAQTVGTVLLTFLMLFGSIVGRTTEDPLVAAGCLAIVALWSTLLLRRVMRAANANWPRRIWAIVASLLIGGPLLWHWLSLLWG